MEHELGLTISNTVGDFTPSADRFYHFVSRETDSMFILTAQIKGYERDHLEILINEDGTRIAVRVEKPFLEDWIEGWKMHMVKRNVFKIPDAVILDKIKAMFNEKDSVLTILMPKAMKGICGIGVEEVVEISILPDEKKEGQKSESSTLENHDRGIGTVESTRVVHDQVCQEKGNEIPPPVVKDQEQKDDEATQGNQPPEQRSIICPPVIAGSAFLVSIIVVVIYLIRKKNPPRKKEN